MHNRSIHSAPATSSSWQIVANSNRPFIHIPVRATGKNSSILGVHFEDIGATFSPRQEEIGRYRIADRSTANRVDRSQIKNGKCSKRRRRRRIGRITRKGGTGCPRISNFRGTVKARSTRTRNRDLDPAAALLFYLDPVVVEVVVWPGSWRQGIYQLIIGDAGYRIFTSSL